ncbi:MAG TPA: VOC family protein [Bacteroidota bacterium]|nr:VOC family protein [Bacteroidota bacterium]
MPREYTSTREVIIRTNNFDEAVRFYGGDLGLPISHRGDSLVGFETGSFCLYVEKGRNHGPVFEFLVPDVQETKRKLVSAGCKVLEEDPSVPRCYMEDPYGLVFNIGPR